NRRRYLVWGVVPVLAAVIVAGALIAKREPQTPRFVVRSTRGLTSEAGCEEAPSFTPDGREVVFDATVDNDLELQAIAVDTGARRRLTHSPGWDTVPAVSPDGRRVAYAHFTETAHELRVVGIEGDMAAPAQTIGPFRGTPSWSRAGDLLYG